MTLEDWILSAGGAVLARASLGFVPGWLNVPVVPNYRGRPMRAALGWGLALGVGAVVVVKQVGVALGDGPVLSDQFVLAGSVAAVFLVGLYDDRRRHPVRGLVRQVGELLRGRMTPGIVKMMVIVVAAGAWTVAAPVQTRHALLGTLVLAGAANLWNLFDVRPGRALKYGVLAAGAILASTVTLLMAATLSASFALLPSDLRERAMLGDSGANVLGFLIGVGLFGEVGRNDFGLGVALGVILILHGVAETVTLSRIIRAVPPLRWFDDLGCFDAPGSSDTIESRSA
jgi:UDP-GlcNAc:undecaprenyl-phosphate/decaprenyl-phosphate GlcNAc-1-phosphate transferase